MPELEASQRDPMPLDSDRTFDEMFERDRFVDGIPLDELQKHLRRTKTMKEYYLRKQR
ncbi:hypothetical protein H0266_07780 [Halobacillus locisalis]|uniref:Uncharacterized protein n=1 Tax=Halobacillus locisalis TaxID=220753 RepID=A0A838CSC9_9BACI|nr:hypothetical protein [Halobacillus locisalis]MBA2174788.1 hypothetical protein [Halobacillus locisalis]